MEYYTNSELELKLIGEYEDRLIEKEREMERMNPKKNRKYTSKAYVHEENRVFYVNEKGVFWKDESGPNMPTKEEPGGKVYKLDPKFMKEVEEFIKRNPSYTVTFKMTGAYGPTIYYSSGPNVYPAVLEGISGEVLTVEDDDAYDIGCG
jgi:hypothetical protein